MQRLHASQRVGDHGDGAWRHQGYVVRRTAQGEGVVRRTCKAQGVVGLLQLLALLVELVLELLLLHLQGHELFTLKVRHVVGGGGRCAGWRCASLRSGRTPAVGLVPALVLLVVESGKGQDVEEEEGSPHGNGDTQLSGVVPLGLDDHGGLVGEVSALALVGSLLGVGRGDPRVAGGGRPAVFAGETFGVGVRGGVLRGDLGCGGHILEKLVDVVEVWNQLQPERHLSSPVVVSHSRFETNVKVQLVLWVVLGPCYLFEAVWLRMNELCVLRNRLVWIPDREGKRSLEVCCTLVYK